MFSASPLFTVGAECCWLLTSTYPLFLRVPEKDNWLTCPPFTPRSLDYLFQVAVEMKQLGLPWLTEIEPTLPRSQKRVRAVEDEAAESNGSKKAKTSEA